MLTPAPSSTAQSFTEALQQGAMLPVMEHFHTLQGEGAHAGTASYFIRLGGCDVGCHWCDVKESWDAGLHQMMDAEQLAAIAAAHCKTVIITGGEPLMWDLSVLTRALHAHGCRVHLETSGAYPLSGLLDWITLSPKKLKLPLEDVYTKAHELKVIVYNQHDFQFAVEQAQKVTPDCRLYLQAEWSKRAEMYPKITEFILKNPQWKASVQSHKYMNIP